MLWVGGQARHSERVAEQYAKKIEDEAKAVGLNSTGPIDHREGPICATLWFVWFDLSICDIPRYTMSI